MLAAETAAASSGDASPASTLGAFAAPTLEDFAQSPHTFGLRPEDLRLFGALAGEKSPQNIYSVSRFLAEDPYFADCTAAQLEDISRIASHAYFAPHQTVFSAGTAPEFLYLLVRGTVSIERAREPVVAPAVIGDVPSFFEGVREASATAVAHVHAVQISIAELRHTLRAFSEDRNVSVGAWLATLPLFNGWSRTRIQKLLSRATIRNLRVGEVVSRQGDPVDAFFFVRRGELEVRRKNHVPTSYRWPESTESVETAMDHALRELASTRNEAHSSRPSSRAVETPGSPGPSGGEKVGFAVPATPPPIGGGAVGFAAGTAGAPAMPTKVSASASNLLPPELANTFSGELLTTRGHGDPSLLRLITSKSRLAALASQSIGVPLLPVPLIASQDGPHPHASSRSLSPRSTRRAPSPRAEGWGKGMPGGTIAYSPTNSPPSSARKPRTTFIDTGRRLPVGVTFVVHTSNDVIGKCVPGALLGLAEASRHEGFAFSLKASAPGTQIVSISMEYLRRAQVMSLTSRSSAPAADANDPRLELPSVAKDHSGLIVNEYHHHEARGVVR
jgi:CRP-like cAMP-binding protein